MDSMILLQIGGFIGFLFLLFIIYILNEKSIEKDIKESKSFENTLSKKGFVTSKEIKFENEEQFAQFKDYLDSLNTLRD